MKKNGFRLFAVMVVGGFVLGYTSGGFSQTTAQSPSPTLSPVSKMPARLIWFTPQPGIAAYEQGLALTNLINRQTELKVILHPYSTLDSGLKAMHAGKIDLGLATTSLAYHFFNGIASELQDIVEEAYPELRLLMGGSVQWWAWITRPDTGIKTIADLRGRAVNWVTPGMGLKKVMGDETLRAVGVDLTKDIKHIMCDNMPDAYDRLMKKKIDAMMCSVLGAKIQEVKGTVGLVIVPTPPEIFNALRPELRSAVILRELPPGYLIGLDKPTFVMGQQMLIVCRNDLNEQTAYILVKNLMNHARELDKVSPALKEVGVKEFALPSELVIPVHPGAIRYFKEAGMWSPVYEARQKELMPKSLK